jgi:hypothetical protein
VEQEQEKDEGNSEDKDEGSQQEINIVILIIMAERTNRSPRLVNRQ